MENQIIDLILRGNTLSTIYTTVIPQPTKKLIVETFRKIDYSILAHHEWDYLRIKIEIALFSLHKRYTYFRNAIIDDVLFDFLIFEDGVPKLAIIILGQDFLLCDGIPVFDAKEYEKNILSIKMKSDYCKSKGLQLLNLPILEVIDFPFLADEFRNALKDNNYAKKRNVWAEEEYNDISNLWMCGYENYQKVRASKRCGCFSCGSIINSEEAILTGQDSSMSCPNCGEATLISDFQGFKISSEIITFIKEKYKDSED